MSWKMDEVVSECVSILQDQEDLDECWMVTSRKSSPDGGTVERYAQKVRELQLELRRAEKQWAGRELEYHQRELQLCKHVAMVRDGASNIAGIIGS